MEKCINKDEFVQQVKNSTFLSSPVCCNKDDSRLVKDHRIIFYYFASNVFYASYTCVGNIPKNECYLQAKKLMRSAVRSFYFKSKYAARGATA